MRQLVSQLILFENCAMSLEPHVNVMHLIPVFRQFNCTSLFINTCPVASGEYLLPAGL